MKIPIHVCHFLEGETKCYECGKSRITFTQEPNKKSQGFEIQEDGTITTSLPTSEEWEKEFNDLFGKRIEKDNNLKIALKQFIKNHLKSK